MTDRPLSILVIGSLPPPIGGTTVLLETLVGELADREDVSVRVVDTSGIRGGAGGVLRLPAMLMRIVSGALAADVVSSHVHLSSFHLTVPFAFIAARAFGRPIIVRLFGGKDVLEVAGARGALVRWLARRVDLLLVETRALLRSAREAGLLNCAWYSNSRREARSADVRVESGGACRRFVFMSQVRPVKGVAEILKAAEGLDEDVTVDIYGPLMDGLSEADFTGSVGVRYRGVIAPSEVTSVLAGYDALLLPTYHDGEGYPGVILEAFSVGMPVVCTRWRALPEIVDEDCGLLVEPRDARSLHEAMAELVADPELFARLREGARTRAHRFSSLHWTGRFIDYCAEVAGRPCTMAGPGTGEPADERRESISIAFLGDIHLGETGPPELLSGVRERLSEADLVVANQESPITSMAVTVSDTIGLRSAPGAEGALAAWGIDAVSLGNNHIFDCSVDGYRQTLSALDSAGVSWFGAGVNLAEAVTPLVVELNGLRVHLMSFVAEETLAVAAEQDSPGCAPLTLGLAEERVAASTAEADAVVVLVHWGYCDYRMPSPAQAELVERLFAAGATAVVGHHSHVVQGVRRRDGRVVAYSLGNFAFAEYTHRDRRVAQSDDNRGGMVLTLIMGKGVVDSCDVGLTRVHHGTIDLDRSESRAAEFSRRCRVVLPGAHEANWKRAVALRFLRRAMHWANPRRWSSIKSEQLKGGGIMLKEMARRDGR